MDKVTKKKKNEHAPCMRRRNDRSAQGYRLRKGDIREIGTQTEGIEETSECEDSLTSKLTIKLNRCKVFVENKIPILDSTDVYC